MSQSIGNFVALYVDNGTTFDAFGGEVSSSFTISKDAIEITTKDSVDAASNFCKEFDGAGEYTFTFSVEGIQRADSAVDAKVSDLIAGTKIDFRFGYNIATQKVYEGSGFITSVSIDSSKNEAVTYSCEIIGSGGLNIVTVPVPV